MFKRKDDVKTFVVIILVCFICIVIALILSYESNTEKLVSVNEYNQFFSNVNYIDDYINYIINGDSEAVYSLIDDRYIEDNSITYDNVLDNVRDYSLGSSLSVTSMKYVNIKDNFVYYVKGNVYVTTYNDRKLVDNNFSILVIKDVDNLSYSLYPVDDNNFEKVIDSIWKVDIKNNKYNSVNDVESVSKEQMCVTYLSDFANNIFNDVTSSYDLLSDNMKKIYTSSNSYKSYINSNIGLISTVADKCKLEETKDKRIYTVIDSNENKFVFTENSIMNYKVDFYINNN